MNAPENDISSPETMLNEGGAIHQPEISKAPLIERLEANSRQLQRQGRETYRTHPYLVLFLALSVGVLVGAAVSFDSDH